MELSFDNNGWFVKLSEFAPKRKPTFLVISKGNKCKGWEQIKKKKSYFFNAGGPFSIAEKEKHCKEENIISRMSVLHKCSQRGRTMAGGVVLIERWYESAQYLLLVGRS